jgi:hypothetical protein
MHIERWPIQSELLFINGKYSGFLLPLTLSDFRNPDILSSPPTAEDFVCFIETIITKLKPNHSYTAILNVQSVRYGILHIFSAMQFRYPEFQVNRHITLYVDSCLNRLVLEGVLLKGYTRPRTWAGHYIVRKMAAAWLDHALTRGTLSWDVHLLKLTMVILQSATGCRPGSSNLLYFQVYNTHTDVWL